MSAARRGDPSAGVRAVAAHGWPAEWTWPDAPLDPVAWSALLGEVQHHRVVGLLAAAVRDGALLVTAEQRATLAPFVTRWMAGALALERLALHAHAVLAEAGIDHRFLKGVALAHVAYGSPDLRVSGDVDVAVASADVVRAIELLEAAIGPRMEPELRPGFDREFGKGATFKAPTDDELDLHRTLVWGALGLTVDERALFAEHRTFSLAGTSLPALGPAATFVHACYSAVLGDVPPRLAAIRDVAQTMPDDEGTAAHAVALARSWRAGLVVATALRRVQALLRPIRPHPLFAWAERYAPPLAERALLRAHLVPGGTYARRVAAVAVIPGLGARARYVRASVAPDRAYLAARGLTVSTHLRRSLRFLDPRHRGGSATAWRPSSPYHAPSARSVPAADR